MTSLIYLTGKAAKGQITRKTVLTVGNFDGLHRGHRQLIGAVVARARQAGLLSAALSFVPHPAAVLTGAPFQTLNTPEERRYLAGQTGLDLLWDYPFDPAFARMPPETFIASLLREQCRCETLFVGADARFGADRRGSPALLQEIGARCGIAVVRMAHETVDGVKLGSSGIKKHIQARRFDLAALDLTRPYFIMGRVAHGRRVGRTLGFPTANLVPPPNKLLPPPGLYLTKTAVSGALYPGLTNIGDNPTFGLNQTMVETHLLGMDKPIYGAMMRVDFHGFLREEHRFASPEALAAQIGRDIAAAKVYFGLRDTANYKGEDTDETFV